MNGALGGGLEKSTFQNRDPPNKPGLTDGDPPGTIEITGLWDRDYCPYSTNYILLTYQNILWTQQESSVRDVEKNRFFLLRRIFIHIQGGQQGVIFRIYDDWATMKREKKTSRKEDLFFSTSLNCNQDVEVGGGPKWHGIFGIGFASFPFIEESSFTDQLSYAGYEAPEFGAMFSLSLERLLLDWLVVGTSLRFYMHVGERNSELFDEVHRVSGVTEDKKYGLYQLTGSIYLQPTLRLWKDCEDGGLELGIQFGVGGGGVWWNLGDEVERGTVFHLIPAWTISIWSSDLAFSFLAAFPLVSMDSLGPNSLSFELTWSVAGELRLGWRF